MGVALTAGLSRLIDEAKKSGQSLSGQVLGKIVSELSKAFQVKLDEVAILHLTHSGAVLSFLYPLKRRCCMIQLRREWGRFSNFSFRTPQRRISAYPARPSG